MTGRHRLWHWRRLLTAAAGAGLLGLLMAPGWRSGGLALAVRVLALGATGLLVFGVLEAWPRRLPPWLPRWAWLLAGVVLGVPAVVFAFYAAGTAPGEPPFWDDPLRLTGFGLLTVGGVVVGSWAMLAALVMQRETAARQQALAFALERSELERQALDARLRLLNAQVEPHFIFNTLANVRALVDSGSPQASAVLGHLVAYLRAAIPRLGAAEPTLAQEAELVRAYLALMHTRMPDRLAYALDIDPAALALRCPPLTLMTLVENAVRHGVDPSEDGGRIDIQARVRDGRLALRVADTGVGLGAAAATPGQGNGTGLAALRERLRLAFGDTARLRVDGAAPHGVVATLDLPAHRP